MSHSFEDRCVGAPTGPDSWTEEHWMEVEPDAGIQGSQLVDMVGKPVAGRESTPNDKLCCACRQSMRAKDAATSRVWSMFALCRLKQHPEAPFEHFYGSTMQCQMSGNDPIALLRLTQDPGGPYYGWYQSHHPENRGRGGEVSMIYRRLMMVEMCFTYGSKAEVQRGRGEIIRLRAEYIRLAKHPENVNTIPVGDR